MLFLGPADFSILSGIPGQFDHPKITEAMRTRGQGGQECRQHWGMPCGTVERAQQVMELGGRFIAHGCDLIWVKNGLEEAQRRFNPLGFTFDKRI